MSIRKGSKWVGTEDAVTFYLSVISVDYEVHYYFSYDAHVIPNTKSSIVRVELFERWITSGQLVPYVESQHKENPAVITTVGEWDIL